MIGPINLQVESAASGAVNNTLHCALHEAGHVVEDGEEEEEGEVDGCVSVSTQAIPLMWLTHC